MPDDNTSEERAAVNAVSPLQQYGYVRCYRAVIHSCGLDAAYLYGLLEDYAQLGARSGRGCVPSQKTLAGKMGCTRETVRVKLNTLRDHGWVEWDSGAERSEPNEYRLPLRSISKPIVPENLVQGAAKSGTQLEQAATSTPNVVDELELPASVPEPRTTPARKSKISPAWRPDRNLAAHVLERTGWTQARLDAEIVKFVGWHESHATRHTNWGTAFARTWVSKALEIDGEREKRSSAGDRKPGELVL